MPTKKSLKNSEIQQLLAAHKALDAGQTTFLKDGDRQRGEKMPFDFSPNLRFALAVNIYQLEQADGPIAKADEQIFRKYAKGGKIDIEKDPHDWQAYVKEKAELLAQAQDVELTAIERFELKLEKNQIPMAVLAGLVPIITDPTQAAAA